MLFNQRCLCGRRLLRFETSFAELGTEAFGSESGGFDFENFAAVLTEILIRLQIGDGCHAPDFSNELDYQLGLKSGQFGYERAVQPEKFIISLFSAFFCAGFGNHLPACPMAASQKTECDESKRIAGIALGLINRGNSDGDVEDVFSADAFPARGIEFSEADLCLTSATR